MAAAALALKSACPVETVDGVIIWGNHSSTQYPDVSHGQISGQGAVMEVLKKDADWLRGEFVAKIQKRGAAIINARKLSSAMSAAKAISDHMHDFVCGSGGRIVSMGVPSDGRYAKEPYITHKRVLHHP